MQRQKHQLILWTYRSGKELDEAVEFCKERGIEFYAVNKNYPEEEYDGSISRKIDAELYIDDRNLGGFPGWSAVWQTISNESSGDIGKNQADKKSGKGFKKLFKKD